MKLAYFGNIIPPVDGMQKISSVAWSPNQHGVKKLAICTADRVVHLFDEQGQRKDKFQTKPSDKGQKSYVVRAVAFSPDAEKIAVAQSDNIVFVYKIGKEWGEKKSICNKFPTSSSVTSLCWPHERAGEVIFGLAEGKVKAGILRSNKSQVMYSTDSYVVSIAPCKDGENFVSGHLDGTIYAFGKKITVHHSIPYALGWGEHIVAAGNDGKVSYYDAYGNLMQRFDYTNDDKIREFSVAAFNPSGDTVVLGNFNRFYIYHYNSRRGLWEEIGVKQIENYYTVTALAWKNDGSKLVTGSLCGSVDWYNASFKMINYKGKFELNYVSPSQVVVKTLSSGRKSVVRSAQGNEITKINIFQDRFAVGNSYDTIIVADLETDKCSEIAWRNDGKEKYDFSNPGVCMVFSSGELTLIEYGNNEPLGNCRTEHMKTNLISARLNYLNTKQTKMIAYLLDLQTIYIQDLVNNSNIAQILHDSKIDFLELNTHANKLLFRDKRRQLYLYNIKTQSKNTLLSYCSYAQWVPDSDVVVAQNRQNLCVWYSIENPDKVTIYNIKGEVESIERTGGKTDVMVNEGNNVVPYSLDESLINFGFAIESADLEKAATILDPLEMNADTEANWKTLSKLALEEQNIIVAEHCYAALGDICKASYLRKISKLARESEEGINYYKVQAKLAILDKQFHRAEAILLDHEEVEEAMEMYQELHKWDESIKIAEKKNHPQVRDLKENYYSWLLKTKQEAKAAEVKENERDFNKAVQLYLQGNLPAKAANVVFTYDHSFPQDILENIASALKNAGMYERAGEFYEQMEQYPRALQMYREGNSYKKAIDLAKRVAPNQVGELEEKCGDWCVSQKQTESAVNHYIEAGSYQKAIEASINSRQWNKAIQLLQHQSPEMARPFYRQIAKHYADVRQYDFGEKYYLKAGLAVEAFEMYAKSSKWEHALRVARENLPETEIVQLYVKQAIKFQEQNLFKEAEKLYCTVDEYDRAIEMYQRSEQYESMLRLVAKYRPKQLRDTNLQIGQRLQRAGNLKQAEHHYIEAGAWHAAVDMYQSNGNWEDAVRCCKLYGSDKETCELAKQWAETLGPDAGMKILLKYNLIDAVIEYLCDRKEFEEAFRMAQKAIHKKPDVHLKYAFELEDSKRYKEAEEHFIKAGKPEEAINMYEHLSDFASALQVAKAHQPKSAGMILMNQARTFIEKREYKKAENCFIQAKKPELAVKMYKDIQNWPEAFRVAKKEAPHLVSELTAQHNQTGSSGGQMTGEDYIQSGRISEDSRDYNKAIDSYLNVTPDNCDENTVVAVWNKAIQISQAHVKERLQEVVRIVAKGLQNMNKKEQAADIYENFGFFQEASILYAEIQNYNKAKQCAQQVNNPEFQQKMLQHIKQLQFETNTKSENTGQLLQGGYVDQALEMMIQKGDWKQALDTAQNQGAEILAKIMRRYVKFTMESGKFGDTIEAYAHYGMQMIPENFKHYTNLCLEIFVECDPKEVNSLRTALYNFYKLLQGSKEDQTQLGKQFNKYLTIAHLANLKYIYEKKNMHALHARTSISMIRYGDLIRMDKLFYDAGVASKKQNWMTYAFVVLNRYLDIFEVIEDPNSGETGDNQAFLNTDIPSPYSVELIPEKNLIDAKQIEGIRNWILEVSYNPKIEKDLPVRNCENCRTSIYEGCLTCPKCKHESEPCIITGQPLLKGTFVNCRSCGKGGLKEYWAMYLQNFANCPWCNNPPN